MAFLESNLWLSTTKNGNGVKIELDDFNLRLVTSRKQIEKLLNGEIKGVKLSIATNDSDDGQENKRYLTVDENKIKSED